MFLRVIHKILPVCYQYQLPITTYQPTYLSLFIAIDIDFKFWFDLVAHATITYTQLNWRLINRLQNRMHIISCS